AEMDVLKGIDQEDWEKIGQIVMEVHDGVGLETEGRLGEITDVLRNQGFEVVTEQYDLLKGTDRWSLYARRPGAARRRRGKERSSARQSRMTPDVITESELRN